MVKSFENPCCCNGFQKGGSEYVLCFANEPSYEKNRWKRTSFVIVSMGFMALFVGMALKSSKAAIITSFLLIFLTQANVGDFTMSGNAVFPFVLTVISFGFAVLSICHVERRDLS